MENAKKIEFSSTPLHATHTWEDEKMKKKMEKMKKKKMKKMKKKI